MTFAPSTAYDDALCTLVESDGPVGVVRTDDGVEVSVASVLGRPSQFPGVHHHFGCAEGLDAAAVRSLLQSRSTPVLIDGTTATAVRPSAIITTTAPWPSDCCTGPVVAVQLLDLDDRGLGVEVNALETPLDGGLTRPLLVDRLEVRRTADDVVIASVDAGARAFLATEVPIADEVQQALFTAPDEHVVRVYLPDGTTLTSHAFYPTWPPTEE